MTYKVAIIGPSGVITGFSALGAVPFAADTADDAQAILAEIIAMTNDAEQPSEKYAVAIVMENLLRGIPAKEYRILSKSVLPSIVSVPGVEGSQGYMTQRLRDYTIRAIGSDIV